MKSCVSVGLLIVTWYLITPPFQGGNLNLGATMTNPVRSTV